MNRRKNTSRIILALAAPVLFALFPIISIQSHNELDISPYDAIRPSVIAVAAAAVMMLLFWVVFRDLRRTSAATSLTLLFFFSYGHVYGGFLGSFTFAVFSQIGLTGNHLPLMIVWTSAWLLGLWAIRRSAKLQSNLTAFFMIIAVVAMAQPAYEILRTELLLRQPLPGEIDSVSSHVAPLIRKNGLQPDIYYIILDGYARTDILNQVYDFDNRDFVDFLERQGFYIADQSRSNYGQTSLSLASSLNLDHLNSLIAGVDKETSDRLPLARLISYSRARQLLEANGYRFVNISSGYRITELDDADLYLTPTRRNTTSMDRLIIDTSALSALRDTVASLGIEIAPAGYEAHRQQIGFALDSLPRLAGEPGPKFVLKNRERRGVNFDMMYRMGRITE
jgi:hypothetical protein